MYGNLMAYKNSDFHFDEAEAAKHTQARLSRQAAAQPPRSHKTGTELHVNRGGATIGSAQHLQLAKFGMTANAAAPAAHSRSTGDSIHQQQLLQQLALDQRHRQQNAREELLQRRIAALEAPKLEVQSRETLLLKQEIELRRRMLAVSDKSNKRLHAQAGGLIGASALRSFEATGATDLQARLGSFGSTDLDAVGLGSLGASELAALRRLTGQSSLPSTVSVASERLLTEARLQLGGQARSYCTTDALSALERLESEKLKIMLAGNLTTSTVDSTANMNRTPELDSILRRMRLLQQDEGVGLQVNLYNT